MARIGNMDVYDLRQPNTYPKRSIGGIRTISIHHWADNRIYSPTMTQQEEVDAIEGIRNFHKNTRGWPDYAYAFTVFPSGRCYYTQDLSNCGFTVGTRNPETIAVALPGNYMVTAPSQPYLEFVRSLVAELQLEVGWFVPTVGHRYYGQFNPKDATACPGDTWDQWKEFVSVTNETNGTVGSNEQPNSEQGLVIDPNAAEVLLSQFPYPSQFPDTPAGRRDKHAWETGWARSMQETAGLSERLERSFIYFTLGYTESGWVIDKKAEGSEESYGIFMRNLIGGSADGLRRKYGMARAIEMLIDPSINEQFAWAHDEIDTAFDRHWSAGLRGPELAMAVGRDAERPHASFVYRYGESWTYLRNQVTW